MGVVVVILEQLLAKAGIVNDADVEKLSEQLLGPLTTSSFGILTLGVAAALGEESIFRGRAPATFWPAADDPAVLRSSTAPTA